MNNRYPILHILPFSGTIPFVLCAVLFIFGIETLPVLGNVGTVINTYSLAIVSFMAGCHWGMHLSLTDIWKIRLPLMSNTLTLVAWFSYLLFSLRISLLVMACCFLALLVIDAKLKEADKITVTYYSLRFWVSKIVIASLCAASIALA